MAKDASLIDPYYSSGDFAAASSGSLDAEFKADYLASLLEIYRREFRIELKRVADVGCGTGDTTLHIASVLSNLGYDAFVEGFDVHPDIENRPPTERVSFHHQDFCALDLTDPYDLVVLFDVIEHVPDPIGFLKQISDRATLVALHIPLDNAAFSLLRNLPRAKLKHPGHLVVLDIPASINLLTYSGLRVRDYILTPVYKAPSGKQSRTQRLLNPIRRLLFSISPHLLQKTLGGVSIMVIAQTPLGLQNRTK